MKRQGTIKIKTSRYLGFLFLIVSMSWNAEAQAQTIPIACAQFIEADKACLRNAITLYSRTDVQAADAAKDALKAIKIIEDAFREAVSKAGADVIAERCTKPEFIHQILPPLMNLTARLEFAGGMNVDCAKKFNAIRVPTQ